MKKIVFQKLHKVIGAMLVFVMVVSLGDCAKPDSGPGTENPGYENKTEDNSA